MWKVPSIHQEERRHPCHQRQGTWSQEICTIKPVQLTLNLPSYFFTIFLYLYPKFLYLLNFSWVSFSLSKRYKNFLFWSFLGVFIFLERLPCTYKNLIKFVCFSLIDLSLVVQFLDQTRDPKGSRKTFPSFTVQTSKLSWSGTLPPF